MRSDEYKMMIFLITEKKRAPYLYLQGGSIHNNYLIQLLIQKSLGLAFQLANSGTKLDITDLGFTGFVPI